MRIAGTLSRSALLASVVVALMPTVVAAAVLPRSLPSVQDVLARYARGIADAGDPEVTQLETSGTLRGVGLDGAFHTWLSGERERTDQNLGPRAERTLRIGDRVWFSDADGNVREYTGLLARRARTERFIDTGAFARSPDRCVLRGRALLGGRPEFVLDVTPDRGETETVYLDEATGLPDRVAYDDDDGRSTIDLSDWRLVGGRRFPFRGVSSDGDHAFDTVQITTDVEVRKPIDAAVFAPFVPRYIDMPAAETVPIELRDGHLFASVRIAGRPYTFLVDTGAQNVLLDKHVAADLGLTPIGALEASGASRTGGLQIVQVDELDIGSGKLHGLVATSIDLGTSTSGAFRIDGILGYPFFAAAVVQIDVAHRTMTFGPPGSLAPAGESLPIEVDRAFPETDLRIGDATVGHFIVDTGSAAELLLYRPFVEKHPGIVPFTQNARNSFGIGGSTPSYRSTLDRLSIGTVPLYQVDTDVMTATSGAFADRFDAGNVGLGILKNFVVTFDESHGMMYVAPGADFDDGHARM